MAIADRWRQTPPPWIGYTGFRWSHAVTTPVTWEWQHRNAEAGGYHREGRRWVKANLDLSLVPIACAPTAAIYAPMIDRISLDGAQAMGYTIDA